MKEDVDDEENVGTKETSTLKLIWNLGDRRSEIGSSVAKPCDLR